MTRLVAALLLLTEPPNLAIEAVRVLPTLAHRGALAAIELAAHALVAALAVAGALALWNGTAGARMLATMAILASVLRLAQSLYWSMLPRDTVPGHEPVIMLIAGAVALLALAIVRRAPRARS